MHFSDVGLLGLLPRVGKWEKLTLDNSIIELHLRIFLDFF